MIPGPISRCPLQDHPNLDSFGPLNCQHSLHFNSRPSQPQNTRHSAPTTDSVSQAEQSERAAMISRQLLQCLQHPQLLHSVGPAAAAAATASTPLWATAASQLLGSTAAAGSTFSASVPGNWRGFSADAPSSSLPADSVPWSSGLASSSQRQVCMVTAYVFSYLCVWKSELPPRKGNSDSQLL